MTYLFAEEFPVLKDLKKLGKITSVVKWIKDNNIPLDMSFLEDYEVEHVPCERYTPVMIVIFLTTMCVISAIERNKRWLLGSLARVRMPMW